MTRFYTRRAEEWDEITECPCGRGIRRCVGQRCIDCHREYMRKWRADNPNYDWKQISPLQKHKNRQRARVRAAIRRNKVDRMPCYHCDDLKSQVRVTNFTNPYIGLEFVCLGCRRDGY